ncbi:hypothetical protein AJ79_09923, partial [Helicocarpus griseus UAMH5409]
EQNESSFEIIEKIEHSYKLHLLKCMKIHSIFSSDKLCKAHNKPLLEQVTEAIESVVIEGENEWEVERILASCIHHKYSLKSGPPQRLKEWMKAWEEGEETSEDCLEDDLPVRSL